MFTYTYSRTLSAGVWDTASEFDADPPYGITRSLNIEVCDIFPNDIICVIQNGTSVKVIVTRALLTSEKVALDDAVEDYKNG